MDYKEFKDYIKEHIKDSMPEKYADCEIGIVSVIKNNDTVLDGLLIKGDESNVTPNIYLNGYFEDYTDGRDMENILEEIAALRMKMEKVQNFDVSQVMDYDKAKDYITCKLINAENNEQLLEDKPYTRKDDFAITYHVMIGSGEDGNYSVPIHNGIMEAYGVSIEELHNTALRNMERLSPVQFTSMHEMMEEMMLPNIMCELGISEEEAKEILAQMLPPVEGQMYCLTNKEKLNGASAILNQDIMDKIAEQLGGDFYILPSSVHETLIVPKDAGMDYKELESMVQEVNATQVSAEERLSNHVYEYDSVAHEVVRSDKAEERKAMREAEKEKAGATKEKKSLRGRLSEKKTEVSNTVQNHVKEHGRKKEEVLI